MVQIIRFSILHFAPAFLSPNMHIHELRMIFDRFSFWPLSTVNSSIYSPKFDCTRSIGHRLFQFFLAVSLYQNLKIWFVYVLQTDSVGHKTIINNGTHISCECVKWHVNIWYETHPDKSIWCDVPSNYVCYDSQLAQWMSNVFPLSVSFSFTHSYTFTKQ